MKSEFETLNQVSVLLVDDASIIRRAIKGLLKDEPQIKLLGEAGSFHDAILMTVALKPDVILLDLHMPDDSSFKPAFVKHQLGGSRVLAMSLPGDCERLDETEMLAKSFGAITMLDKADLHEFLIPAILSQR